MESNEYVLNPDYSLKNDIHRVVLKSKLALNPKLSSSCKSFIHPVQAMIFSFFTYKRTLDENIKLLSNFLDISEKSVLEIITPFIENEEKMSTLFKDKYIGIPKNLIININKLEEEYIPQQIDIETLRCSNIDLKSKRINTGPSQITFMLTNRCVTKCCYCYANTNKKVQYYVPTERILDTIREAKKLDLYNVNIIGGEIFLHKDWDIILKEIISNGFSPMSISTKVPITNEIANKIKASGYNSTIQFSLDSIDSEILQKTLCVKPNYIEEVKKGFQILDENDIQYRIETVITKFNASIDKIEELYNYLLTLKGIKQWEIRLAMFSHYKDQENYLNLKSNRGVLNKLVDFISNNIQNEAPFKVQIPIIQDLNKEYYVADKGSSSFIGARCSALCDHMFILPDGKVTICEQLYWNENFIIGDLNHNNLLEIWNSPRALELVNIKKENIQKDSVCSSCDLFEGCFTIDKNRCWSDVIKAYGTDNWDFPDPRCNKAPSMKNNLKY